MMAQDRKGNCAALAIIRFVPFTIQSLLAPSRLPPLEARILLGYVLGRDRAWLAAHPEAEVENDLATNFRALCERRAMGEPVAYVIGEREFYGLRVHVTWAVLIPRPETELLVDLALERMARETRTRVLDLGTGSGAIALAIAHDRPQAEVAATDISPDALAVARQNAWRLGLRRVRFIESDWFASVPEETF